MHKVQSTFMMWDPYCTCNKKNKLWTLHNVQDDNFFSFVDYHGAQICVQTFDVKS